MAASHLMIVYSNPVKGREDEYNRWYDEVHLDEYSALPGVLSAARYAVPSGVPAGYAAVYELSSPPDVVMASMNEAVAAGTMHMSDALDPASLSVVRLDARP
jgi:hypothetical protein